MYMQPIAHQSSTLGVRSASKRLGSAKSSIGCQAHVVHMLNPLLLLHWPALLPQAHAVWECGQASVATAAHPLPSFPSLPLPLAVEVLLL
jgi:hypothetical protein